MTGRYLRLLIIEDVEDHALLLVRHLEKEGFVIKFQRVETRDELQGALDAGIWDAIISDYNLPGFSGRDALNMVRETVDIPFVLISGAIGEEVAAELMKAGAHAYISKGNYSRLAPVLERELKEAAVRKERRQTAEELARYRQHLEDLVRERTVLLEQANEALRQSEGSLKLAIEAAAMCTWRLEVDSRNYSWDDNCYALFGLPLHTPLPHDLFLSMVHPEERELIDTSMSAAMTGETGYDIEHRIVRPDGSVRWVMCRGEFAHSEPNVLTGVLLDITERKSCETEIVKAREAAEAAAAAKSHFLANMSHEIRTPLNGVLGITDLLAETELTSLQQQYLQMIRNSAEVLLSVVNDVLDFSKIEAGMMELEQVEFDLRETIEKVVEVLALHAQRKHLQLALHVDALIPERFVGDPVRLRQIVANLVSNAVKFTDSGEVVVRLVGRPGANGRWLVSFSITDTGIGIAPDKLDLLFNSFTQIDPTMARSQGGTGLGLAISKSLVEQMGGRISVQSEEGVGSTFAFDIELGVSGNAPMGDGSPFQIAGLRALVLDDDETNRQFLVHSLSARGALVDTAQSGSEAVRMIRERIGAPDRYDIALLDLNLPDMSGFEVAADLRRDLPIEKLAIMMLSSEEVSQGARRARDMGMLAYVVKPVRMATLMEAIARMRGFHYGGTAIYKEQPTPEPPPLLPFCSRILVVEDNPVNLTVAEAMLSRAGARVTAAVSGTEAVTFLETGVFDLVLMDVQMPGMDGMEATRTIRKKGNDVPVIGLTALALQGDRERCLEAGMDDYLTKPFSPEDLLAKADHWMRQRPRPAASLDFVMEQVGGSREIADSVIATFRDNAMDQLSDIGRSVENVDPDGIRSTAHRLKGAVMVVGAETARCLAEQMETAAAGKDLLKAKMLLKQLEAELSRVLDELSSRRGGAAEGDIEVNG